MVDLRDLLLFVRAIEAGSLSAAGRTLGLSPAVASKRLTRLEARLGTRLMQRSSRKLTLTDEGSAYFERARSILAELEDAEAAVAQDGRVRGSLRITATVAFGQRWLAPLVAEFARQHPQVSIQLHLGDGLRDLVGEGFDLAIRIGQPQDSSLIARRIVANRRLVVASPAYLARAGMPQTPADLSDHDCILMMRDGAPNPIWRFTIDGSATPVAVRGRLSSDDGRLIQDWALAGLGLALKSLWDVAEDLRSGRLVSVLDGYASEGHDIFALYPSRRFVSARTRQFIDALVLYLAEIERCLKPRPSEPV